MRLPLPRPALPVLALLAASPVLAQPKPPPAGVPMPGNPLPSVPIPGAPVPIPGAPGSAAGKPPPADAAPSPAPTPRGRAGNAAPAPRGAAPQPSLAGKPPPLGPNERPPARMVSSGTGFLISARQALTNNHVVRECRSLRARNAQGRDIEASVRATDEDKDLALIELGQDAGPGLTFRAGPEVRRGDAVVTYGFPLAGMLSSGPTLTTGDVSALTGLSDNQSQFQISAPVQPGNSGGPLLDASGNVMGVIVSKLNAQRIAQRTGDIPQNVNFAVKGNEALDFLRRQNVRPQTATSGPTRSAAEVGELVHPSVLFLRCMG
ncbi:S1C family serine protease [Roseomonas sp. BN140053]|uniref:S1C family serine protease n=1 Tax=Roseomonas sp. BN140053 TaxID=3391898 RepID=UPI0039E7C7B1